MLGEKVKRFFREVNTGKGEDSEEGLGRREEASDVQEASMRTASSEMGGFVEGFLVRGEAETGFAFPLVSGLVYRLVCSDWHLKVGVVASIKEGGYEEETLG